MNNILLAIHRKCLEEAKANGELVQRAGTLLFQKASGALGALQAVQCDVSSERGHCQYNSISTLIYPASASPFSRVFPPVLAHIHCPIGSNTGKISQGQTTAGCFSLDPC